MMAVPPETLPCLPPGEVAPYGLPSRCNKGLIRVTEHPPMTSSRVVDRTGHNPARGVDMSSPVVEQVVSRGQQKQFIALPRKLYQGDPNWTPPLLMDHRRLLGFGHHPFYDEGKIRTFLASRDGRVCGRVAAIINPAHNERAKENRGFFGFFDTIDDQEVADALLNAAENWLASRGMSVMRGPFSLSINEEPGLLVEGFDSPPVLMCPHHRAYQGALAENAGLEKVQDLFGWMYKVEPPPPRAEKAWQTITSMPEVRIRPIRPRDLKHEIDEIFDVFNDAWQDNWGFVPSTDDEARKMAKDLALVMDKRLAFFVEVDGQAIGRAVARERV